MFAITIDTAYYSGPAATRSFRALYERVRNAPVITPLNNIMYNTQTGNLAQHGLHPHYQHLFVNLPQLLGPALIVLLISAYPFNLRILKTMLSNARLASAASGTLLLSIVPHQEPRFLLPTVPLLLTCIRVPTTKIWNRIFWISWGIFNVLLAVLMGIYHQGGVVPAQLAVPSLIVQSLNTSSSEAHNIEVFWWKTYPPPNFLLGPTALHPATNRPLNLSTVPLMGFPQQELVFMLMQHMPTCDPGLIERLTTHREKTDVFVVAPLSAWRLPDPVPPITDFSFSVSFNQPPARLNMQNIATFRRHVNLDDMDFGDDGVSNTLQRVVGRRGLGVWAVHQVCGSHEVVYVQDGVTVDAQGEKLEPSSEMQPQPTENTMPGSSPRLRSADVLSTLETSIVSA